jgi:hypothetical protein
MQYKREFERGYKKKKRKRGDANLSPQRETEQVSEIKP